MTLSRTTARAPADSSARQTPSCLPRKSVKRPVWATVLVSLLALAGCAGGSIGIGGFGGGGGGGVGVGVSVPIGRSADQTPYVVSEGEQVIQPGMTSAEVIRKLGYPYYQFGVRQDNATVWNYRMRYGSCLIYQVSVLPNGIVKDAGTAQDPACDRPERRAW